MSQVSMEANGRFGQLLAAAVQKKGLSLREVAAKLDYTYEQIRKLWLGTSTPSPLLLKELCKILDIDLKDAQLAANADRAERKFGSTAFTMQGRSKRHGDIDDIIDVFSDQEWGMFVAQMKGFAHQKRRAK